MSSRDSQRALRETAHPLDGGARDYEALLDIVDDRVRFVLIGEASHGTHEFYHERAAITKRLIEEKSFGAVAVEADWPDAYRVNRFVRHQSDDTDAVQALGDFKRFPAWMWRNADVVEFVAWLRQYNTTRAPARRIGFYGLDLYSLHASIDAVLAYLAKVDPPAAERARYRYSCFDHFGEDPQTYGYAASFGMADSCESEVISQLVELRRRAAEYARRDGRIAADEFFFAEQNARLVTNAEAYYRAMFQGRVSSWNLRDQHMAETLDALTGHLARPGEPARIVVWAHNSHIGDARATEMSERGELNIGQLVRQRFGQQARLIGFSTYTGTVTAASNWDGPAEVKRVRPGLPGSHEAAFKDLALGRLLAIFRNENGAIDGVLQEPRLERAIGVIYLPASERLSHYFYARLPQQFDAVVHVDDTRAVEPLERGSEWHPEELPETFPTGM